MVHLVQPRSSFLEGFQVPKRGSPVSKEHPPDPRPFFSRAPRRPGESGRRLGRVWAPPPTETGLGAPWGCLEVFRCRNGGSRLLKNWSPVAPLIFPVLLDVRRSQGSPWGGSGALAGSSCGEAGFPGRSWRVAERFGVGKLEPAAEKLVLDRFPDFPHTPRRPGESGKPLGGLWAPPRSVPR